MTRLVLIAVTMLASACAGQTAQPWRGAGGAERWRGYVLRDGVQVPVELELAQTSGDWTGRLRTDESSVPLRHVRVTALGVHFELPGEGAFDGTVAGDRMAGSVSGTEPGAFALTRQPEQSDLNPDRR